MPRKTRTQRSNQGKKQGKRQSKSQAAKATSQAKGPPTRTTRSGSKAAPRIRRTTRLVPDVRAHTIDLHFELDPTEKRFRGEARYALQLDKRRRSLELHAAELRLSSVRLRTAGQILTPRLETHPGNETVTLHFDRLLPAEAVRLELRFAGRVRNDLRGLYRSTDDSEPWLATQLCPTDARRFFPCFDEPEWKAQYRIRVTVPSDQTVISNAPVDFEEQLDDGRKLVQFDRTPPLSAYLIAVAVGPFEASPTLASGSTVIRVHTLRGGQKLAAFAREAAGECLGRLERFFDMPHPYPKLDLVALPDFAFGAMENAGAVFFRDSVLLLDPTEAAPEERKRVAETIAHELSHMWFGNLVTMSWWNDLWLNESFATWMAYEIIDSWQPDWRIWLDFAHRRETALEVDALATSHPIAPRIRSAEEAHENFDAITYTKGASVLRMLAGYLGHETFRAGIRLYIRRHRERTASAADLWAALGEVSGEPIEAIVSPWTLQTGYPLISLRRREDDGLGVIELRQERFLALPRRPSRTGVKGVKGEPRWTIPWVGRIGRGEAKDARALKHLLVKRRERTPSHGAELTWIYGNAGETGFFRVEHGDSESADLLANLPCLSPFERIGFVGHQWALARAGRIPIARLLDLIAALGVEHDPDVLKAVEDVLVRLGRRVARSRGSELEERLRAWVEVYYGAQVDRLGFDARPEEDERTRMRRARILAIVGLFARATPVLEACAARCRRHLASGVPLAPELADEIVRCAASVGDPSLHKRFIEASRRAVTPQTRRRMLFALAEFDAPGTLAASLTAALDPSLAPAGDRAGLWAALLARPQTAPGAWRRLQRAWPRLEKQMPAIPLARLAAATAEALPHAALTEIRAFFEAHPLAAGGRVLRQVAEEMAISKRFETRAGRDLEAYLAGSADTP